MSSMGEVEAEGREQFEAWEAEQEAARQRLVGLDAERWKVADRRAVVTRAPTRPEVYELIAALRVLESERYTQHCKHQTHLTQTMRHLAGRIGEELAKHPAPAS
jgi:hypothetical protein